MKTSPNIFVALPVIDELEFLPNTINCILNQSYQNFNIYIIVNQAESWWTNSNKKEICLRNKATLEWLYSLNNHKIKIIDKSSKGKGWTDKEAGVGIARKTVMDSILTYADNDDYIVSMDADTTFEADYFEKIIKAYQINSKAAAISVPYYHKLTGDEKIDRAILRYEIYMRYYAINLWRINTPYNFTALGSAIVVPIKVYKAVGGLTPKKSGEDFYFLQKIRNYGEIINYLPSKVYPAARFSNRVNFGTGPAMIKGANDNWDSYPIYNYMYFNEIYDTFQQFKNLFNNDIDPPLINFVNNNADKNLWDLLRKNFPDKQKFISACHTKINALRILQYLKHRYNNSENNSDEENLIMFLKRYFTDEYVLFKKQFETLSFKNSDISFLDSIRNMLAEKEEMLQTDKLKAINNNFV